jgi:hypothetical protein
MVVAMSRDICVHLYNEIVKQRPDWHDPDPEKGAIKIIMTGSASDKALLRPHIYSGQVKKRLEKRFKDPADPLRLVIVRDMWLTGFDAPCVHTMYVDKPMKGHKPWGNAWRVATANRYVIRAKGHARNPRVQSSSMPSMSCMSCSTTGQGPLHLCVGRVQAPTSAGPPPSGGPARPSGNQAQGRPLS